MGHYLTAVLIGNSKQAKEITDRATKQGHHWAEISMWAEADMGKTLEEEILKGRDVPGKSSTGVTLKDIGLTKKESHRAQTLNKNRDIVENVLKETKNNQDIPSKTEVLKRVKAKKKHDQEIEKAKRKKFLSSDKINEKNCKLFHADISDIKAEIEPNSIDAIITDPPYGKEYLSVHKSLSEFAGKYLKNNGSMLVMVGQSYLPEIFNLLITDKIRYHWFLAYLTSGGQSAQLWQRRVNTFWKPVIWLTKGAYKGDWAGDVLKSAANDNDKRFHVWGQSESGIANIIEKFTYPKEIICDPFLGGGSTAIVSLKMDRFFIGIDKDKTAIETAKKRLLNG